MATTIYNFLCHSMVGLAYYLRLAGAVLTPHSSGRGGKDVNGQGWGATWVWGVCRGLHCGWLAGWLLSSPHLTSR